MELVLGKSTLADNIKKEFAHNITMIPHDCYYKDECCFAHGIEELRDDSSFSSYKTKICKNFQEDSVCFFGIRCSYKHVIK